MKPQPKRLSMLALAVAVGLGPVVTLAAQEDLRESAEVQTRLKQQTQSVGSQIDTVIAEFERNGIGGDDLQTLKAIRSVLGNLSESQMQQVVDLLQQARGTEDVAQSRRSVTQAVVGQKTISTQLADLLNEYRRQQAVYELSDRFDKLAERQNANLKSAVSLARQSQGKQATNFTPEQNDAMKVQQAEQAALKEEVRKAVADLQALNQNPAAAPGNVSEASQRAIDAKLEDLAKNAADDLGKGNLFRAAGTEQKVRDELREMSRLVAPPKDNLTKLQEALANVENAIEQQKNVAEETKAGIQPASQTEMKQADVVDTTDTTRKDIKDAAPTAAEALKNAQQNMQQARGDLMQNKREDAGKDQQKAIENLTQAKADLEKQIKEEEKKQENRENQTAMEQVKDLLERTKQLRAEQTETTKTSAAVASNDAAKGVSSKQAKLQDEAQSLQSDSMSQAPTATPLFESAAAKMGRATTTLTAADATSADKKAAVAEQQKQADEALAEAQKILEKKLEELAQAEKDLEKIQQAQKDVAKLMQDQQKVNTDTAKAAEQQNQQNSDAPKPQDVAKDQQKNQDATQQAQANLPQSAQQAQQALNNAQQQMQNSQQQLNQQQPQGAQPNQQQAMQQLANAKDALDKQAQQLQQQLNTQQMEQRKSLGELAQQIEKAQQEINQNAGKLPEAPQKDGKAPEPAKDAAKGFEKTQDDLTKMAAEERDQLPADATKAIEEANKALTEATAKADGNKPEDAKANAEAAHDKLEEAKAALQMAMNGMKPGEPMAGQPQPGQPMPGQPMPGQPMPGMMPGQMPGMPSPISQNPQKGNESLMGAANGPLGNNAGASKFMKLPERERQALMSTNAAKYPEEYAPMIEQYLRNLSDDSPR